MAVCVSLPNTPCENLLGLSDKELKIASEACDDFFPSSMDLYHAF